MIKQLYNKLFNGKAAQWTAIFTGLLAVFTVLLWKVSQTASDVSVVTQRAFVTFSNAFPVDKVANDPQTQVVAYRMHLALVNNGTTPTKIAIYQINVGVTDTEPAQGTDFDRLPQSRKKQVVFGPKAVTDTVVRIEMSDLEAVSQHTKHAFIWAWVVYRDIFPGTPPRLSEYCSSLNNPQWTLGKPHGDPVTEFRTDFDPCDAYNCYDENCPDYAERIRELP